MLFIYSSITKIQIKIDSRTFLKFDVILKFDKLLDLNIERRFIESLTFWNMPTLAFFWYTFSK